MGLAFGVFFFLVVGVGLGVGIEKKEEIVSGVLYAFSGKCKWWDGAANAKILGETFDIHVFLTTLRLASRSRSSVGLERLPAKEEVTGSSPVGCTRWFFEKDSSHEKGSFFICMSIF